MKQTKLNPYTQAMVNCLAQFTTTPQTLDANNAQFLANMIQGRFLQFLVNRLVLEHQIDSKELEKKISLVCMQLLGDKFFAVFREKIKAKPEIVYELAKMITDYEQSDKVSPGRTNRLYLIITKTYFAYEDFSVIFSWIQINPEVERLLFLAKVEKEIADPAIIRALTHITDRDPEGIVPKIFERYLKKNKLERMINLVKTGDWRLEAEYVQRQEARWIAWRSYVDQLQVT